MRVLGGVDIKVFMPIYFCGYLPTLVPIPIVRVCYPTRREYFLQVPIEHESNYHPNH
jgi:hypothetical protein